MAVANKHKVIGPYVFNILGLEEDLTPDTTADYLATYDASAGKNKKVLLDNLGLGGGNAFTIIQPDSGTAPTADSETDTLTLTTSNGLTTVGDSGTDSISINLNFATITVDNTPTDQALAYIPYYEGGNHRNINISSLLALGGGGAGDVTGPSSSTDNAIARFDGTTGKIIQDYTSGTPTISDTGIPSFNNGTANAERVGALSGAGSGGTSFGYNCNASGTNSVCIGFNSTSAGGSGIAIGAACTASSANTISLGFATYGDQTNSVVIGTVAGIAGTQSAVVGYGAQGNSSGATSVGYLATSAQNATVIGASASGNFQNAVCVGASTSVTGIGGVAIGQSASAVAGGTAIGVSASCSGSNAFALGKDSVVSGTQAIGIGVGVTADATDSIAIGYNADSNAKADSLTIGTNSVGFAANAITLGSSDMALTDIYLGWGGQANWGSLPDCSIQATSTITGTNLSASDLIIKGSKSTGTGSGGSIKITTSPSGTTGTAQNTTENDMILCNSAQEIVLNAEDSATADGTLWNNSISFYLDETGNTLVVKAKYGAGTVKTGTVALT